MQDYKSLWVWMIVPMVLMQLGIAISYWGDFTSNTWAVHVHYWNATLWYGFLISQPWLFAKGRMAAHRTWGMIGLLLAGAMVFLSVGQLNRDIEFANFVRDNPGQVGPFEPWFFFAVMMSEMVLITAFAVAIVMAIIKRKSIADHSWWLASTAFILIFPALGRGIQNMWLLVYGFGPENTSAMTAPILICQIIIIALTLGFAWRWDKLRHPATWLTLAANLSPLVAAPLAQSPAVQEFWRSVIAH